MTEFNLTQSSRKSDTLPADKVAKYLSEKMPGFIQSKQLHIEQFPSGASNLTYELSSGGKCIILRRPPPGTKAASAHDMVREYHVIESVGQHYSLSPKPLLLCEDKDIIGDNFFIMEKIEGLGIGKQLPVKMSPAQQAILCSNFVSGLVELHQIDIEQSDLAKLGKPTGYVTRQLEGWQTRYLKSRTDDVASSDSIYQWLKNNLPYDSGLQSLVHNDYKFDNLILDPDQPEKIKGVLDWEMTTLGDPLLDLGCSLAYWINADDDESMQATRMMPTHLEGMMTRQKVFETYCLARGITDVKFTPCYYHGQTDNPKFANFGQLVNILLMKANSEISLQ